MFTKSASEDGPQFRLLKDAFPRLLESSENAERFNSDGSQKSASEDGPQFRLLKDLISTLICSVSLIINFPFEVRVSVKNGCLRVKTVPNSDYSFRRSTAPLPYESTINKANDSSASEDGPQFRLLPQTVYCFSTVSYQYLLKDDNLFCEQINPE